MRRGSHGTDKVDQTVANSKGSTRSAANAAASSADMKSQLPLMVRQ